MLKENQIDEKSGNQPVARAAESAGKLMVNLLIPALSCLVLALILLSFNIWLIAGVLIIGSASLVILFARKINRQFSILNDSFSEITAETEKKEKVIADFSHRIREPLNNIVLLTDQLMDSGLQKKQKELLETFAASANNMVATVNELTMESAALISQAPGKTIPYNILSTIQNTIDLYNLKPKVNLDIIFNRKDPDEYESTGDPILLKQIFLDVFSTIGKQETDDIPARVHISTKKEEEYKEGRVIGFRIQTDRNVTPINRETGSGILASKLIAKARGYYHQEAGENFSVFKFSIPFRYPNEPEPQNSPSEFHSNGPGEKVRKELNECNILLVEDNLINQEITSHVLKPFVKNLDTASNGQEALDKLRASKYDLILLDVQMPEMDGITLAMTIRGMEKGKGIHVPIIAITAEAMIGDRERCLSAGMDEYLSKPYHPDLLLQKIRELIT